MIYPGSRYANLVSYKITRSDGSIVTVLRLPSPPASPVILQGYYQKTSTAPRLDVIANFFLKDATAFWQLCDANNAVVPDALAASSLIGIPQAGQ
jgi:hypothetical protein